MHLSARIAFAAALFGTALPAAAEGVLDRIRDSGEVRLGVRADAAPLSYTDAAGLPAGYAVDVCRDVVDLLAGQLELEALEAVFVPVTAEDRFDAVTSGTADMLCGADTITLERRAIVDFSTPTFVDGAAVLLKSGESAELSALAGKKVGVVIDTTTEEALRNTLTATEIEAEILPMESHTAGIEALQSGEIAAYFGDQSILFALLLTQDTDNTLSISDNTLTIEKQGIAMPRGDNDFRLAVDTAISELYLSGRMVEIFRENLPGAEAGVALKSLFLIAPDLP